MGRLRWRVLLLVAPLGGVLVVPGVCGAAAPASASASAWASAGAGVVGLGSVRGLGPVVREFPDGTEDSMLPVGVAWGDDGDGEIGDGTAVDALSPVAVDGGAVFAGHEVTDVVAGTQHACGIASGAAYCWGDNSRGQAGYEGFSPVPKAVGGVLAGRTVTAISPGGAHTCAISDGRVYCWGVGEAGELGNGVPSKTRHAPAVVGGLLTGKYVTAISTAVVDGVQSHSHTCAVADGAVYCWGSNGAGELGIDPATTFAASPVAVDVGGVLKGKVITSISAGWFHSCALAGGIAFCWGDNGFGELGTGDMTSSWKPRAVSTMGVLKGRTVTSLSVGPFHTCVTAADPGSADRQAYCWGVNQLGFLGTGLADSILPSPTAVDTSGVLAGKSISSLTSRGAVTCVVAAGASYCWGDNGNGGVGDGSVAITEVPVAVDAGGVLKDRRVLVVDTGAGTTSTVVVVPRVFPDVPTGYVFYDDVAWMAGRGVTQGNADGSFAPAANVSRQAMAAFVFRFVNPGVKTPVCVGQVRLFSDVGADNQFCGAVEWLVKAKIVTGGGLFSPGGVVTRGVMADWVFRGLHRGVADQPCVGSVFTDVVANTPSCGNIEWLASTAVTSGYPDKSYKPGNPIHRDAMAAFFHRAFELTSH